MRQITAFAIALTLALAAPQANGTSDDAVLQWNEIAITTIGAQPPFPSSRAMATVSLAVFEAVNAITGKYEPYLGGMAAADGASTEAAAITAAHGVLKAFFPAAAAALDQQRDDSLASIPDGPARTSGIAVGEAAAAAMIAERTGDGSAPAQFHVPTNADPYEWQRTPSCSPAGGAFFHWANVRPFGIVSSSQFRAEPPPALSSDTYATDFNEVLTFGVPRLASPAMDRLTASAQGPPAAFSGKPTDSITQSRTHTRACRGSSSPVTTCWTSSRTSPMPASTAESTSAPTRTQGRSKVNPSRNGISIPGSARVEVIRG